METMNKRSGIYIIKNLINNHRYVGSAVNPTARWARHLFELRANHHWSKHLQAAYNKYGEESFVFKVILFCPREMLIWYEQQFIDQLIPEYNTCKIAGSQLGRKHTPEAKAKMAAHRQGWRATPEQRLARSIAQTGRVYSPEARAKMAEGQRTCWAQAKAAGSTRGKGRRSPEVGAKISAAKLGHSVNPETREKLARANKGKKATLETRAKISAANYARWERIRQERKNERKESPV